MSVTEIKVLSLMEPWASLIAFGSKRIETRSWRTSYRGPLYIHASRSSVRFAGSRLGPLLELIPGHEPAPGFILCRCVLKDCVPMDEAFLAAMNDPIERMCGEYALGRFAWLLQDVQPLRNPIPAKGRLGIWSLTLPTSQL